MKTRTLLSGAASCSIASLTYLGAVPPTSVFTYVVVSVLLALGAVVVFQHFVSTAAVFLICAAPTFWSLMVNAVSGDNVGPSARSSALCGIASGVALFGVRTLRTPIFLGGVLWSVAGAMNYGAAGEVSPLIGVLLVSCGVTAHLIFRDKYEFRSGSRASTLVVLVMTGVVITSLLVVPIGSLVGYLDGRNAPTVSRALADQTIDFQPPWQATRNPAQATSHVLNTSDPNQSGKAHTLITVLITLLLALFLVALAALVLRLIHLQIHLLIARRKLKTERTSDPVSPAWCWFLFNARRYGVRSFQQVSVDRIASLEESPDLPHDSLGKLKELAALTTTSMFTLTRIGPEEVRRSWTLSQDLVFQLRSNLPPHRRLLAQFRKLG